MAGCYVPLTVCYGCAQLVRADGSPAAEESGCWVLDGAEIEAGEALPTLEVQLVAAASQTLQASARPLQAAAGRPASRTPPPSDPRQYLTGSAFGCSMQP